MRFWERLGANSKNHLQKQMDRERKISYDNTYMWNLKKGDTNEHIYKNRRRVIDVENKFMVTRWGINWGIGIDIYIHI